MADIKAGRRTQIEVDELEVSAFDFRGPASPNGAKSCLVVAL